MTPPIYRARRKDNGEWVEGYLYQNAECAIFTPDDTHFIDQSTLAISFDNGDTWYDDVEDIKEALLLYCYHDKGGLDMERITRGEAIKDLTAEGEERCLSSLDAFGMFEDADRLINKIFDYTESLEQRIKELEAELKRKDEEEADMLAVAHMQGAGMMQKQLEAERDEVVVEFESGNIHEDLQLDSVWRDLISNNETYTIKVIKAKQ